MPGDRIKTDRRDCLRLAELARAGELRAVWIPDPADEAIRDLARAREDAVNARTQVRQQLKGFLLRHDVRMPFSAIGLSVCVLIPQLIGGCMKRCVRATTTTWRATPLTAIEDAGQQEVLNWFALAGAMEELGASLDWSTFVETHIVNANKVSGSPVWA